MLLQYLMGIRLLSRLGFDVFTYKSIRSRASRAHDLPNVCYVDINRLLAINNMYSSVYASLKQSDQIALSYSFDNASFDLGIMKADIASTRAARRDNQLLIVSVYSSGQSEQQVINDYVAAALLAHDAGAQAIELNFSFHNVYKWHIVVLAAFISI